MSLQGKEIVVGVTGGVACYKALELLRNLKDLGATVSVIMTASAMEFVQPLAFQTITGRPVATSLFSLDEEDRIGHIKIVEKADAMIVAPATANLIGKAANGIADDYLTTTLMALKAPLILAPAMNCNMWDHPALQENLKRLEKRGATIVQPDYGYLACGTYGMGRLAALERIVSTILKVIGTPTPTPVPGPKPLQGVNVLITAGPTREKIDAARYISNYSSGKMGYAIAEHCRDLGGKVTLITGPTSLPKPQGCRLIEVNSALEMHREVMEIAPHASLIIKSAAVADYRVETPSIQKVKKKEALEIRLVQNPDILKQLGAQKGEGQFLVGFAAESENIEAYARKKFQEKNLDLIVANSILEKGAGFEVDTNRVSLIDAQGKFDLPLATKSEIAKGIIAHILKAPRWQQIKAKRSES